MRRLMMLRAAIRRCEHVPIARGRAKKHQACSGRSGRHFAWGFKNVMSSTDRKLMNLDNFVPGRFRDKTLTVLCAAGFDKVNYELLAESNLRTLISCLGGANLRRQKLVAELLDAVVGEFEAA